MEIKSKEIVLVSVDSLKEHPRNKNIHSDKQKKVLKKIILKTGFREPLIVSLRSGFIVSGHLRFLVAKECGFKVLPVIYQNYDSDEEEYKHLIAANEIARHAIFDQESFLNELENKDEIDFEEFGLINFKFEALDMELGSLAEKINEESEFFSVTFTLSKELKEQFDEIGKEKTQFFLEMFLKGEISCL